MFPNVAVWFECFGKNFLDISTNVATDKKSSFVNSLYTIKFIQNEQQRSPKIYHVFIILQGNIKNMNDSKIK